MIQTIKVVVEIDQQEAEKTISQLENIGLQQDPDYMEELENNFLIRGKICKEHIERLKSYNKVKSVWIDAKVVPV